MTDGVRKHSLLLVDGDPKSQRVLEVSLKKAGFDVITAADGLAAQARLAEQVPDLVISDTQLGGIDGFELCRRLKEDPELARVPFIFLSSKKSIEDKIRGLELGVEDYLTKPIFIKEITTRVRILLQRHERESLESSRDGRTRFSGQLADIGVVDLVQTIDVSRKSGIVHIEDGHGRRGAIYFRDGRVIDAEAGRLSGSDALYRLFSWSEGRFEVEFKPLRRRDVIEQSVQVLLMEGMRRLDEWTRLQESLPPLDGILQVDYHVLAERLAEIPDEVNQVLRLFDGRRTLAQVIEDAELSDLETAAAIGKLVHDQVLFPPSSERAPVEVRGTMGRLERWLSESPWASKPGSNELTPVPEPRPPAAVDQPTERFQTLYGVGAAPLPVGTAVAPASLASRASAPTPPPQPELFQTLPGYATSPLATAEYAERVDVHARQPEPRAQVAEREPSPEADEPLPGRRKERINTSPYGTPAALDTGLLEEDPESVRIGRRSVSGQIDVAPEAEAGRHVTTETFFTLQAERESRERVAGELPAVPEAAATDAAGREEPTRPGAADPTAGRTAQLEAGASPSAPQPGAPDAAAADDPRALPAVGETVTRPLRDDERTPGPSAEFRALSSELARADEGEPEVGGGPAVDRAASGDDAAREGADAAAPAAAGDAGAAGTAAPVATTSEAVAPASIDGSSEAAPALPVQAAEQHGATSPPEDPQAVSPAPAAAADVAAPRPTHEEEPADAAPAPVAQGPSAAAEPAAAREAAQADDPEADAPVRGGTSLIHISPRDSSQLVHADPRRRSETPGPPRRHKDDLSGMSRSEMLDELGQKPGRGLGIALGAALVLGGATYVYVAQTMPGTGQVSGQQPAAASEPSSGVAAEEPETRTPGAATPGAGTDTRPSSPTAATAVPAASAPGAAAEVMPARLPPVELPGAVTGGGKPASPAVPGVQSPGPAAARPPGDAVAPSPSASPARPAAPASSAPTAPDAGDLAALERACDQAYSKGKYKDALASCGALLQARPDQPHVLVNLAHAALERGNLKAALQHARKAVALDPGIADAWVFIGGAEQELGNGAAARAAYRKYLELAPDGKYARDLRVIVENL